jgi:NADH-quinone oxidoreductase subunit L
MTKPLLILSILSIISGYVGKNFIGILDQNFWSGTNVVINQISTLHGFSHFIPIMVSLLGIFIVYRFRQTLYKSGEIKILLFQRVFNIIRNKYYFDELYNILMVKNIRILSNFFWKIIDVCYIDFLPNASVDVSNKFAKTAIRFQTGYIYHYGLLMIIGIFLISLFLY